MILQSVITCPRCGTAKAGTMPTDACQFFYVCTSCGRGCGRDKATAAFLLVWLGAVSTDASRAIGCAGSGFLLRELNHGPRFDVLTGRLGKARMSVLVGGDLMPALSPKGR